MSEVKQNERGGRAASDNSELLSGDLVKIILKAKDTKDTCELLRKNDLYHAADLIEELELELSALKHSFTDYRANAEGKACMMCNTFERVDCYNQRKALEKKIEELTR